MGTQYLDIFGLKQCVLFPNQGSSQEYWESHNIAKREPQDIKDEYEEQSFRTGPQDTKAEYEEQFVKAEPLDIKEKEYAQGNLLEQKVFDNRSYFYKKPIVKKLSATESKRKSDCAVLKKAKPVQKLHPTLPKPVQKPPPYSYIHPEKCVQCPKCSSRPKNKNLSKHLQKHAKSGWYEPGSRYGQDRKKENEKLEKEKQELEACKARSEDAAAKA